MNIKDIAKKAGVSISTVSRVINNTTFVSPDIKEKIEKIIEESGYRPNSLAKELLRKKTNMIGVLVPRIDLETFSFAMEGINTVLRDNNYNILLANSCCSKKGEEEYLRFFQEKRVDGVIYFATSTNNDIDEVLTKVSYPTVILGHINEKCDVSSITYDNKNAAKVAVKYLIRNGHTRIGFVGISEEDTAIGKERITGYMEALADEGITLDNSIVIKGNFEFSDGYAAAKKLFSNGDNYPTALFCATDRLAVGAAHYINEKGLGIPNNISIASVDNLEISAMYNPPITTVGFDYFGSGAEAATILLDLVKDKKNPKSVKVFSPELYERKSVKKIENL